ncbi:hypothetical protein BGZ80_007846 [Entomortierella chlamydospora]|uniref:EngB-type G domain-containing protein n=1 Tax=Entomortierella chlamydospora TaxID=101097 RepID=A0A9P6N405_9FUNG|nr:hypothetical protein BGZ80_007846 [Entomortierella chlamydospora]
MLASGFRARKCNADLLCSIRSVATNTNCRYLSISSPSKAQLPFFHKKLKKNKNLTATGETLNSLTPMSTPPPQPGAVAQPSSSASDTQPAVSKRQAFKSITPSPQIMHDIRVQGLGENAEMWSFDKSSRGNKTIRPWDKKLSPEEWKDLQKAKRLPPKQVWFEERTSKIVEKEQVKFPGMRFVAGATSMKSVPQEEALLKIVRPDLFDDLEEVNKLLREAQGEGNGTASIKGDSNVSEGKARLNIGADEIEKLQAKKRAKEAEIKESILQEIAIVGRSNVGKSTMLNKLTESPNTARVSSKPGLTRQLNFYRCGDKFVVVDMPGYGFAFAKEEDKSTWKELIEEYLSSRKSLRRIYVMIDARHGLKAADKEFLAMLDSKSKKFQVVLTKCDLVTPLDLARRYMVVREELNQTYRHAIAERLLMVSSYTGAGMNNLRKDMLFVCGQDILVRERERPKSTIR